MPERHKAFRLLGLPSAIHRGFKHCINVGTEVGNEGRLWRIHTPAATPLQNQNHCRRTEGVDYALIHSSYNPPPQGIACGKCDSCNLRLKGFRETGAADPIRYET